MIYLHNPFSTVLVIAGLIMSGLLIHGWRFRRHPAVRLFLVILALIIGWSWLYALELAVSHHGLKNSLAIFQYVAIVLIPPVWLWFILAFTARNGLVTRSRLIIFFALPFVFLVLLWTNPWHQHFFTATTYHKIGGIEILTREYGLFFWIMVAYCYITLLLATLLMLRSMLRYPGSYKNQITLLLLALMAPWVANFLTLTGLSPSPWLDLTPFAFTLSGLTLGIALFRFHFLDIMPVARATVFDQIKDALVVVDQKHKIVDYNPPFERFFLTEKQDLIGQPLEPNLPAVASILQHHFKGLSELPVINLPLELSTRHFEPYVIELGDSDSLVGWSIGFHDATQRISFATQLKEINEQLEQRVQKRTAELSEAILLLNHEISERQKAEKAIHDQYSQLEQLLAAMHSIIIGLDYDLNITHWNSTAENVFGLHIASILPQTLNSLPIKWDVQRLIEGIQTSRISQTNEYVLEIPFRRPDQKEGFLTFVINPFAFQTGKRRGFLLIGEEVTERKILESQLNQAQRLESIGQLAAGIAHEINTPTQYVGDNTRFVRDSFEQILKLLEIYQTLFSLPPDSAGFQQILAEARSYSEQIDLEYLLAEIPTALRDSLEGVARVTKIVQAMRAFSHIGSDEMTETSLNDAIENTLTVARNEYKYVAEIETHLDPDLPHVFCLPNEFNQVILNMIINASHAIADVVKTTGQKGRITITTTHIPPWVEIRISDTGTGIPEHAQPRIFDPFFTTKEVGKGTGQGLAISHNVIVEKHKGTIRFETQVGEGTTFIIRLPVRPTALEKEVSN